MFHTHTYKTFVCKFITSKNGINQIIDSYTIVRLFFSIMLLDAMDIYYDSKMENMKMKFPLKRSPKFMKSLRIYRINKIPFMLEWAFEDVLLDIQFHGNLFLYFLGHESLCHFLIRHFYSVNFDHFVSMHYGWALLKFIIDYSRAIDARCDKVFHTRFTQLEHKTIFFSLCIFIQTSFP